MVREHRRIQDAEDRLDQETLKDAVRNAEQGAQHVMAILENDNQEDNNVESRAETLDTIQKEMGFLMQGITVHTTQESQCAFSWLGKGSG